MPINSSAPTAVYASSRPISAVSSATSSGASSGMKSCGKRSYGRCSWPGVTANLTLQHDQLMSERGILCFKPALRLERRGQQRTIKQELLDLAAVCEEAADNIDDRMPGG